MTTANDERLAELRQEFSTLEDRRKFLQEQMTDAQLGLRDTHSELWRVAGEIRSHIREHGDEQSQDTD